MAFEFLKDVKSFEVTELLFNASAVYRDDNEVKSALARRGIPMEDFPEVKSAVRAVGRALSVNDAFDEIFKPKDGYPTPYKINRFCDGYFAVFYSALKQETCIAEVSHHQKDSLRNGANAKKFLLIECSFEGHIADLVGYEEQYPDLISETNEGYPFCQQVAIELRKRVSGLHTTSARKSKEICVPVFVKGALSKVKGLTNFLLSMKDGAVIVSS